MTTRPPLSRGLIEILDRLHDLRAALGRVALVSEDALGATHPLTMALGDRLIETDELFLQVQAYEADSVTREALAIATRGPC
jgi:hypothetical protein